MKRRSPAPLCAALSMGALIGAPTDARESIVGKWAIDRKCDAPLSVIVIEPLRLSGEDFYCRFTQVVRQGNTVNWRGQCNFSEQGYEPSRVTARMRGNRLYYRFAGRGWNGPFDRCAR